MDATTESAIIDKALQFVKEGEGTPGFDVPHEPMDVSAEIPKAFVKSTANTMLQKINAVESALGKTQLVDPASGRSQREPDIGQALTLLQELRELSLSLRAAQL